MVSQDKSPDAFRTISEVAEDLDLPQHVLRFWETRFSHIKPLKRGGGRRYYRPDDVELLRGIRHLLYGEGYTIKGVQRILKEQGPRFVMRAWIEQEAAVQAGETAREAESGQDTEPPASEAAVQVSAGTDSEGAEALPKDLLPEAHAKAVEPSKLGGMRFMERFRSEKEGDGAADESAALSKDDVRRLQATLFELLECKRMLDQAR